MKKRIQQQGAVASMSIDERRRLRARHTCMRDMSSMRCGACNAGVPFPPLVDEGATLDEFFDAHWPRRSV